MQAARIRPSAHGKAGQSVSLRLQQAHVSPPSLGPVHLLRLPMCHRARAIHLCFLYPPCQPVPSSGGLSLQAKKLKLDEDVSTHQHTVQCFYPLSASPLLHPEILAEIWKPADPASSMPTSEQVDMTRLLHSGWEWPSPHEWAWQTCHFEEDSPPPFGFNGSETRGSGALRRGCEKRIREDTAISRLKKIKLRASLGDTY